MKIHTLWLMAAIISAEVTCLSACHDRRKGLASTIDMADTSTAGQLTAGFYGLEDQRWRWTAGDFSAMLEPPPGADDRGAWLRVQFYIPDSHIRQVGPVTLTADVEGEEFLPETVTTGGSFSYSRPVPAAALRSNIVRVNFSFDKVLVPGNGDGRELGAVVTRLGLVSK